MTINAQVLDRAATEVYARLFHALSDPTRLAVLQHLALGEHLDFAQSTVSKHLSCLLECGLVTVRAEGRASWYGLADADDLAGVLCAAQHLLDATGARVTLCSQLMRPEVA